MSISAIRANPRPWVVIILLSLLLCRTTNDAKVTAGLIFHDCRARHATNPWP
jgi:hypothetical protein